MSGNKTRIYRQSKSSNYTIIHNEVLRRNDLSWKAKGIMCYALSLPDDWVIYLEHLEKQSTDGKDAFRSGWNELKSMGYVKRYPIKEKGKIIEWRTEILESVGMTTFPPLTEKPQVEKPYMEKPQVENPKLLSTYNTNYLSKQNTNKDIYTSNKFDEVWNAYPQGRKQGKEKARKSYNKAIKDGVTHDEILKGLEHYKQYIQASGIETQFIKQGATWFNNRSWTDEFDLKPIKQTEQRYEPKVTKPPKLIVSDEYKY